MQVVMYSSRSLPPTRRGCKGLSLLLGKKVKTTAYPVDVLYEVTAILVLAASVREGKDGGVAHHSLPRWQTLPRPDRLPRSGSVLLRAQLTPFRTAVEDKVL